LKGEVLKHLLREESEFSLGTDTELKGIGFQLIEKVDNFPFGYASDCSYT
jgi:hypothetical protein